MNGSWLRNLFTCINPNALSENIFRFRLKKYFKTSLPVFMRNIAFLFLFAILSSCASQRFVETNLYFGMSKNDGTIISDSAWNVFVEANIAHTFYKGFTVVSAQGKWLNEKNKKVYTEPSHVVVSVNKMNKNLSVRIDSLRAAYKNVFQQESVLRVDKKVKVSF
jgi:hypothetical protein